MAARSGALPLVLAVVLALVGAAPAPALTVVADHLARPRGLAAAPDGTVYATLVGTGGARCGHGRCYGGSGRIVRLAPGGVQTVARGLLSVRDVPSGTFTLGADQLAVLPDGRLATAISAEFNEGEAAPIRFVPPSLRPQVGHLVFAGAGGALTAGPDIAAVEFAQDPDHRGTVSNPYGVAALGDAVYVSDSAANDLLEVRGDQVRLIATFPQSAGIDPVPDALAAGPDGALYVGEFTGGEQRRGTARIWRVVPGQAPRVFARGLTSISALAFGPDGSLYATEFRPGDVVRIAPGGRRTRLAAGKLHFPGGVAVTPGGAVYVSNWTTAGPRPQSRGELKGRTGQIVRL